MNGATIQQHPCSPGQSCPEAPYPFTAAELEWLTIYRAAIHAGFYSDQSGRMNAAHTSVIDAQLSEWLAPERR